MPVRTTNTLAEELQDGMHRLTKDEVIRLYAMIHGQMIANTRSMDPVVKMAKLRLAATELEEYVRTGEWNMALK